MAEKQHILIVDDDHALAGMLAQLLETEGYACTTVHNGREALLREQEINPDLVILDVMMPGDDGITTLRKLRQTSSVAVLMLTAMGEEDDRILGLEAGADDYLAKPFAPRELVLRIQAILRRLSDLTSATHAGTIVEVGPLTIDPRKDRVQLGGETLQLTGAEFRILQALASSAGEVVSREQLTEFALGRELTPYDRALDTHISHLRRKLGASNDDTGVAIHSSRGAGYRLVIDS